MTTDPAQGATITVPQVIDQVWQYVSSQISSGAINDVLLPMTFKTIIGQQGLDIIATRFRYLYFLDRHHIPKLTFLDT